MVDEDYLIVDELEAVVQLHASVLPTVAAAVLTMRSFMVWMETWLSEQRRRCCRHDTRGSLALLVPVLCLFLLTCVACCFCFWSMLFILSLWLRQLDHAMDFNSHILYLLCPGF